MWNIRPIAFRWLTCVFALGLSVALMPAAGRAAPVAGVSGNGLRFRDYSGVVQAFPRPIPAALWRKSLGWDREDLDWGKTQPQPGRWNQPYLSQWGRSVLAFRKAHVHVLPILDYNAPWSWERGSRTFTQGDTRWRVQRDGGGHYIVTAFHRDTQGRWKQVAQTRQVAKDQWFCSGMLPDGEFSSAKTDTIRRGNLWMWPLAKAHVKDWENYVRHVVSYLRRPPYHVKYFQIWNEAYPTAGYWFGSMRSYFQRVVLPAAKIIHALGGKVVYGGWPAIGSATLQQYASLLDKYHAWKAIDVLDVHYRAVSAFQDLEQVAQQRGYENKGVWQTEISGGQGFGMIGDFYPRFLYWALTHGAESQPDRYKVFWYAYSVPNDPAIGPHDICLYWGPQPRFQLAPFGVALRTLGELFGRHNISTYSNVSSDPALKPVLDMGISSLEGFVVAGRIVVAVQLIHPEAPSQITLTLPKLQPANVRKVERWDLAGYRTNLTTSMRRGRDGGIQVSVPVRNDSNSPQTRWRWTSSWPQAKQPAIFYVTFDLARTAD